MATVKTWCLCQWVSNLIILSILYSRVCHHHHLDGPCYSWWGRRSASCKCLWWLDISSTRTTKYQNAIGIFSKGQYHHRGIFGRWHSERPAVSQNCGIFGWWHSINPVVSQNLVILERWLSENPAVSRNHRIFGVLASKKPVIPWDCVILEYTPIVCPLIEPATTCNSVREYWFLLNSGTVYGT
jgi:hypothetical protein